MIAVLAKPMTKTSALRSEASGGLDGAGGAVAAHSAGASGNGSAMAAS